MFYANSVRAFPISQRAKSLWLYVELKSEITSQTFSSSTLEKIEKKIDAEISLRLRCQPHQPYFNVESTLKQL